MEKYVIVPRLIKLGRIMKNENEAAEEFVNKVLEPAAQRTNAAVIIQAKVRGDIERESQDIRGGSAYRIQEAWTDYKGRRDGEVESVNAAR